MKILLDRLQFLFEALNTFGASMILLQLRDLVLNRFFLLRQNSGIS